MTSIKVTQDQPVHGGPPVYAVTIYGRHVGEPVEVAYTQDPDEAIAAVEALIVEAKFALAQLRKA